MSENFWNYVNKIDDKNQENIDKVKERQAITLDAKSEINDAKWSLEKSKLNDDFETDKEVLAKKDELFSQMKEIYWDSEVMNIALSKIEELVYTIDSNKDRVKMLNTLSMTTSEGGEISKDLYGKIKEEFDDMSDTYKTISWAILAVIWLLAAGGWFIAASGFWAWIMIWLWVITLKVGLENIFNGSNGDKFANRFKLLDTINDIYPEITENHFKEISEKIDNNEGWFDEAVWKVAELLIGVTKDRILTDEEVKKIVNSI